MSGNSFTVLFLSELFAATLGFGVMLVLARRLSPAGFADFEYASAVAGWWLVLVRGGFDTIVYREAARRPKLIRSLTDLLIGLRAASSVVALAAVALFASFSGLERGRVVAIAGLVLIPSALACDVGLRARCRFGALALAQAIRAIGLALCVMLLVSGPGDAITAGGCVFIAEVASTLVLLLIYWSEHGMVRPRFRRRAWTILARRGAVAGASRFARVSLYAADLLILGSLAVSADHLGSYAAARRLAYALLALGLIVPSAAGPWIAREWSGGPEKARIAIASVIDRMIFLTLPAIAGLIMTSDRWMDNLFGQRFAEGGTWLALIAARIPFVLLSNLEQSALIACREENRALKLILGMVVLGLVIVPPLAIFQGIHGVCWGILVVEAGGAMAGWIALGRIGVMPRRSQLLLSTFICCLALAVVCRMGDGWPLAVVVVVGVLVSASVLAISAKVGMMLATDGRGSPSAEFVGGPAS